MMLGLIISQPGDDDKRGFETSHIYPAYPAFFTDLIAIWTGFRYNRPISTGGVRSVIDLYALCGDLKNPGSALRKEIDNGAAEILSFLRRPSEKTLELTGGWREDFRSIYGDLSAGPSGNSRLARLAEDCGGAEELRLRFFSVQTCYSLLIKIIMESALRGLRGGEAASREELILGSFAGRYGVANYGGEDWYRWPAYELENGFGPVLDGIRAAAGRYEASPAPGVFRPEDSCDLIKQIYESMIPKELRHALGEYYTPDWLAEWTLRQAAEVRGTADAAGFSVIDPTCGSGTFLCRAVAMKRRAGLPLEAVVSTVRGLDLNPLAVLTAKTNYLLSVLDLLDGKAALTIPVHTGDVLSPAAAGMVGEADLVVGNPPWVNWEYLPASCRGRSGEVWARYGLLSAKGLDLSFSKEDVSALITCAAMDRLLKEGGAIGFILRQGLFKSAQNGAGFRRFRVGETPVRVLRVDDLSGIRAFEDAAAGAALFFARKGQETVYPVPYFRWRRRDGRKTLPFDPYAPLPEVLSHLSREEQRAQPASEEDPAAPWITASGEELAVIRRVLGTNPYRARTGVFTGGANAVYWLRPLRAEGDLVTAVNVVDRAKRKTEQVTVRLEKTFLFPMLKGGGVRQWSTSYNTCILCPHTAETKIRPVSQEELERAAPRTWAYLDRFREVLDGRRGFAGWERALQQQAFHTVLRVGAYTFAPYKVVWKYIASRFICAVIGTVDDPFLGEKLLLPNEKVMYVATEREEEAYYLCGMLSSTPAARCVESYMNPTSISAHVLRRLYIPPYDASHRLHREISALCREGHGKDDITPYLREIDKRASALYAARPPAG